jgi:hypothetical protein
VGRLWRRAEGIAPQTYDCRAQNIYCAHLVEHDSNEAAIEAAMPPELSFDELQILVATLAASTTSHQNLI